MCYDASLLLLHDNAMRIFQEESMSTPEERQRTADMLLELWKLGDVIFHDIAGGGPMSDTVDIVMARHSDMNHCESCEALESEYKLRFCNVCRKFYCEEDICWKSHGCFAEGL